MNESGNNAYPKINKKYQKNKQTNRKNNKNNIKILSKKIQQHLITTTTPCKT